MRNRRGAEKILSIYWFAILIITVVGIYGMVTLYYHHPYDVRELEANLLANKVADCISQKGMLVEGIFNETTWKIFDEFKNNFLDICNITFNIEKGYEKSNQEQYYLEINFYDLDLKNLGNITKGNTIIKEYCEALKKEKGYRLLPKCINKRFFAIGKENKQILIDIFIGVRKTEKNVKG